MVVVPLLSPVAIPAALSIVALAMLLLSHVPPGVVQARLADVPGQMFVVPVIVATVLLTVIVRVRKHPLLNL